MICCGEERTGNFCPECGKKVGAGPLSELLLHLKHRVELVKNDTKRRQIDVDTTAGNQLEYARTRLKNAQEQLAKWQSWLDALTKLMQQNREPPLPPDAAAG
jgi:hypothetical protein